MRAVRTGNFSQTFSAGKLVPIYDPATNPRAPFPDNIIPTSRLDPVGLKAIGFYPLPNVAVNNSPLGAGAAWGWKQVGGFQKLSENPS